MSEFVVVKEVVRPENLLDRVRAWMRMRWFWARRQEPSGFEGEMSKQKVQWKELMDEEKAEVEKAVKRLENEGIESWLEEFKRLGVMEAESLRCVEIEGGVIVKGRKEDIQKLKILEGLGVGKIEKKIGLSEARAKVRRKRKRKFRSLRNV